MEEITLEKVDKVIERTNVTYGEAKEALEKCNGDVLDAIIYIENKIQDEVENFEIISETSESIDQFKSWLKDLIRKGNVSRIKIKKDEEVLVDVPVNAGIAAAAIGVILPPVLAFGVIAAVATKITIEITMEDGKVEVVNKYISKAAEEVKEKACEFAGTVKEKIKEVKEEASSKTTTPKQKVYTGDETVYSYTVKFDDEEK